MKFFGIKPFYSVRRGSVKARARNQILHQLGQGILQGLSIEDASALGNIEILVGCHDAFYFFNQRPRLRIGIQTEQFLDQAGNELWGMMKKPRQIARLFTNLSRVDVMLDINSSNRPWWEAQDLSPTDRAKLHYGPYIFPSEAKKFKGKAGGVNLFFGDLGARRKQVVQKLISTEVKVLPRGTYGVKLERELEQSSTVVNIHFDSGVYTEAPRLLTSYLVGKPVMSEMLDEPFIEGVHYLGLENFENDKLEKVYNSFSNLVTEELSFAGFVHSILRNTH